MKKNSVQYAWLGVNSKNNTWVAVNEKIYNVPSNLWLQKSDDHSPKNGSCLYLYANGTIQGLNGTKCDDNKITNSCFCEKML